MLIKITMTIMNPSLHSNAKTDSPYLSKIGSNRCQLSLARAPIPQYCAKKGLTKNCET